MQKKLKAIRKGDTFRVIGGSLDWHTATSDALQCGRGYVRVDTSSKPQEAGQACYVVNMHGSTEVVTR